MHPEGEISRCTRCPVGVASGALERERCPFVPRRRVAGAVLHVSGEPVDRIWFVRSGAVLVTRSVDEERVEGTPWAVRRAGTFLGLEGLVTPDHLDSARALTDVTLCGAPLPAVERWLSDRRPAARVLLDAVLRSRVRERPFRGNVDGTAQQRTAVWLLEHASRSPAPLTRRVLSGLLGMRPETLSRALRRLSAAGAIRHTRRTVEVLDRARLRTLARSGRARSA